METAKDTAASEPLTVTGKRPLPDYVQTMTFTDNNGQVRELIFPKGLDLDRPKRSRTTFSAEQLTLLDQQFRKNAYLVGKERQELADQLGLSETQVKVWYQNRRTKDKRDREKEPENLLSILPPNLGQNTSSIAMVPSLLSHNSHYSSRILPQPTLRLTGQYNSHTMQSMIGTRLVPPFDGNGSYLPQVQKQFMAPKNQNSILTDVKIDNSERNKLSNSELINNTTETDGNNDVGSEGHSKSKTNFRSDIQSLLKVENLVANYATSKEKSSEYISKSLPIVSSVNSELISSSPHNVPVSVTNSVIARITTSSSDHSTISQSYLSSPSAASGIPRFFLPTTAMALHPFSHPYPPPPPHYSTNTLYPLVPRPLRPDFGSGDVKRWLPTT